uniref:Uncharacterized protein n=1 Tax=Knipowitschia caucasica TaxID=637954 RepID=A0AAV2JKH1_KNICA
MYKSSTASIIIDCEDKTLLPELEEWPLSSPEEDFTPHICHLCCCPEPMKISARGRLQFLQPGPLKRGCLLMLGTSHPSLIRLMKTKRLTLEITPTIQQYQRGMMTQSLMLGTSHPSLIRLMKTKRLTLEITPTIQQYQRGMKTQSLMLGTSHPSLIHLMKTKRMTCVTPHGCNISLK